MTYLYTDRYAVTLPDSLTDGQALKPGIRFQWAGMSRVRVLLGEDEWTLKLRVATDADRAEAINRGGWVYAPPHTGKPSKT